jgi:hypothetical protein
MLKDPQPPKARKTGGAATGMGLSFGLLASVVLGAVTGNMGLWIPIGMLHGLE